MKRVWNLGRWRIMFKPGRYQWGMTTKGFADVVVATRWGIGSVLRCGAALTPGDTKGLQAVRSALEGEPGDVADGFRLAAELLDTRGDTDGRKILWCAFHEARAVDETECLLSDAVGVGHARCDIVPKLLIDFSGDTAALTPGDASDISTGIPAPEIGVIDDKVVVIKDALTPGDTIREA